MLKRIATLKSLLVFIVVFSFCVDHCCADDKPEVVVEVTGDEVGEAVDKILKMSIDTMNSNRGNFIALGRLMVSFSSSLEDLEVDPRQRKDVVQFVKDLKEAFAEAAKKSGRDKIPASIGRAKSRLDEFLKDDGQDSGDVVERKEEVEQENFDVKNNGEKSVKDKEKEENEVYTQGDSDESDADFDLDDFIEDGKEGIAEIDTPQELKFVAMRLVDYFKDHSFSDVEKDKIRNFLDDHFSSVVITLGVDQETSDSLSKFYDKVDAAWPTGVKILPAVEVIEFDDDDDEEDEDKEPDINKNGSEESGEKNSEEKYKKVDFSSIAPKDRPKKVRELLPLPERGDMDAEQFNVVLLKHIDKLHSVYESAFNDL